MTLTYISYEIKPIISSISEYYIANKRIPETKTNRPEIWYLVESCCIFFIVILRWFTSALTIQEPLKINSAITIP